MIQDKDQKLYLRKTREDSFLIPHELNSAFRSEKKKQKINYLEDCPTLQPVSGLNIQSVFEHKGKKITKHQNYESRKKLMKV